MNSNAGFVQTEKSFAERFKYFKGNCIVKLANRNLLFLKRKYNSYVQGSKLLIKKLNWSLLGGELSLWIIEALIEGVAWNFALAYLFGVKFTVVTALAYGVLSKQLVSLYWRLKKDGTNATLHTTD